MAKFESIQKAQAVLAETREAINGLIEKDLAEANCREICLDSWMNLFSKNKDKQNTYHELCDLEMALIDAQLYIEHERTEPCL